MSTTLSVSAFRVCGRGVRANRPLVSGSDSRRLKRNASVANQPADARRVVALPDRVRRKCHVSGPTVNRAGRQQNRVADGFVASAPPVEHSSEHGHIDVGAFYHLAPWVVRRAF